MMSSMIFVIVVLALSAIIGALGVLLAYLFRFIGKMLGVLPRP